MFGTTVDTAIGLVLILFLFSVLVSTAMEVISGVFALRSQALANTIAQLIEDPHVQSAWGRFSTLWGVNGVLGMFGSHARAAKTDAKTPVVTFESIYEHALVAGSSGKAKPDYVPAANFAAALLQKLSAGQAGADLFAQFRAGVDTLTADNKKLKDTLDALIVQADGDLEKLRAGIQTWFDNAMDRLSGQYKRYTQVITFLMALALAVTFNVDALKAARTIYAQPQLQATLAAAAQKQVQDAPSNATNALLTNAIDRYADEASRLTATAPLGWPAESHFDLKYVGPALGADGLGWLLTAIAAMLGGPFWFGILQTLVNARNAGPQPKSSTSTGN